MPLDLVQTLAQLVSIPSVNPMGRAEAGPHVYEARLTAHLEALLTGLGLRVERQTVAPGRDNLVARLDGDRSPEDGGRLILFDAHQDTVPADNMTIAPWTPEVRQGRLYGRGACDTKGGMAAMLATIARLADERPRGMPSIVMACTVDEEYTLAGAAALASQCTQCTPHALREAGRTPLIPRLPDAAIVAEPTGLDVVVAHKGVIRWRCHALGRAAHGSHPELGRSAIYDMARLVAALERYDREVVRTAAAHPLCGPPTMNVGTIHGGSSVNIVPQRCTIEIELRLPPGGDPPAARGRLIDYLAAEAAVGTVPIFVAGGHKNGTVPFGPRVDTEIETGPAVEPAAEHDPPYMQGPPLSDESNGEVAQRLSEAARSVVGDCRPRGVAYATNAAFYARAGVPSVVFGPGSIEQAHTEEEWVSLDELERAAEVLYRFVRSWT